MSAILFSLCVVGVNSVARDIFTNVCCVIIRQFYFWEYIIC